VYSKATVRRSTSRSPPPGRSAGEVAAGCLTAGLAVNAVTPSPVRFAPPLVVSEAQIDEAAGRFAAVLEQPTSETEP